MPATPAPGHTAGPAEVSSSGLKWDMDRLSLAFGAMQSTSNVLAADRVTLESTLPVVWTTELDHLAFAEALGGGRGGAKGAAAQPRQHPGAGGSAGARLSSEAQRRTSGEARRSMEERGVGSSLGAHLTRRGAQGSARPTAAAAAGSPPAHRGEGVDGGMMGFASGGDAGAASAAAPGAAEPPAAGAQAKAPATRNSRLGLGGGGGAAGSGRGSADAAASSASSPSTDKKKSEEEKRLFLFF